MIRIELARGYIATVDDEDEHLARFKWHGRVGPNTVYAARRMLISEGTFRMTSMHRQILGVTDPKIIVDHLDGDGLNNTRANLRAGSHADNMRNSRLQARNKTGYRGVQWSEARRKFMVFFLVDGKNTYFGCFDKVEDAARVRREVEAKHWPTEYPRRAG